jgi:hypothetical protein
MASGSTPGVLKNQMMARALERARLLEGWYEQITVGDQPSPSAVPALIKPAGKRLWEETRAFQRPAGAAW